MKRLAWVVLVLALAACSTPGNDVAPVADDFAFIEVALAG